MTTKVRALALHITWTTYGIWLPGDRRGWIKKGHAGVKAPNWRLEDEARALMAEDAVVLTDGQRSIIEATITRHSVIRNWQLHAVNARTNHVHVVITTEREPDEVLNQLKARCSQKLSDAAGLTVTVAYKAGRRRWFTEGGDKKLIHDEEQLRNTIRYVREGQ